MTGDFLVDETNRNGRILIDFCREHNLVLRNTFKLIKKKRIFSWKGDHGHGQSLIDFIAVNNRDKKCVRKCKVVHRVDKLSDHFPVVAILKLKKPRMIRKTMLAQHDREWLKDPANRKSFEECVFCSKGRVVKETGKGSKGGSKKLRRMSFQKEEDQNETTG